MCHHIPDVFYAIWQHISIRIYYTIGELIHASMPAQGLILHIRPAYDKQQDSFMTVNH
jgi:hypothetical protein